MSGTGSRANARVDAKTSTRGQDYTSAIESRVVDTVRIITTTEIARDALAHDARFVNNA